jgi:hypothetical protein
VPAADFDLVGLSEGSTKLELDAPSLSDTEHFRQGNFLIDIDTSKSALSFCEESLKDALEGNKDSELYDDGLLDTFGGFSRILHDGLESIEISNGTIEKQKVLSIRQPGVEAIGQLRKEIPKSQRVRVAGKVDVIAHSTRMFTLILDSGRKLKGVATDLDPECLKAVFGKKAVISGTAVYRPSGSVLRIEADRLEEAQGDVSVWSKEPKPLEAEIDIRSLHQPQGPRSGVSATFGKWPGDETDEEVRTALKELS